MKSPWGGGAYRIRVMDEKTGDGYFAGHHSAAAAKRVVERINKTTPVTGVVARYLGRETYKREENNEKR